MEVQEEVVTNMESNSMENHHHLPDHEYGSSPSSLTENNRTDDQNLQEELGQIVKGKRTKRQRPQSPIPFRLSPSSSSSAESSPAEEATTEEEKDMANCLILLARGVHARRPQPSPRVPDPGLCVYECKTCSRTFPSFQALGGHRASHKKPKLAPAAAADDRKNHQTVVLSDEEGGQQQQFKRINHHPPLSLGQLDGNRSNKLHECSICGAEFMSGQALGGHMRRHRGPVMAAAAPANTTLTLSPMVPGAEGEKPRGGGGGGLSLDLNLPAMAEDENHNRESKFGLASKQQQEEKQQAHLVFSTPTLVDCHY